MNKEKIIDDISMFFKQMFCIETDSDTKERLLELTDKQEIPSMPAQTAINELCEHFLRANWFVPDPLGVGQINAIIVCEIERKHPKYRI